MTDIQYLTLFYFIHSKKLLNLRKKSCVLRLMALLSEKETTWELWLASGAMIKSPSANAGDAGDAGSTPTSTGRSLEKEMAT